MERLVQGADFSAVASLLADRHDEILVRWLAVAREQPFHRDRPDGAVADHLPDLPRGLADLLSRTAPSAVRPTAPLDDEWVLDAARRHALARYEQGLGGADVVTEFRLLRHEIGRVLRSNLSEEDSPADVVAAELVINDALDGASAISLRALSERIDEVRAEYLATTLHDVRQPIATAKVSIQVARRALELDQPDTAKASDALARADHALNRMASLLTRLADASRLALGALEPQFDATKLGELVSRVIEDLDPQAAARMRVEVAGDDAGLWDAITLEQVVGNLLSNAVKYSPPASPIEVRIAGEPDEVRLSVRDHGPGVPAEHRERIFGRFDRSPDVLATGVDGQGLGLYLSRGIVESHGGRIWVEPPPDGVGSLFIVLLPREAPAITGDQPTA